MAGNFKWYYLLNFTGIYHYHENTKQLKNEINQKKRNQTFPICHVSAWNATYLMSYLASYFKRVNHKQNLSVKNSKPQELYILNINKGLVEYNLEKNL